MPHKLTRRDALSIYNSGKKATGLKTDTSGWIVGYKDWGFQLIDPKKNTITKPPYGIDGISVRHPATYELSVMFDAELKYIQMECYGGKFNQKAAIERLLTIMESKKA